MELAVLLLFLSYVVLIWRLICRLVVSKGGKRWVGHGVAFIFSPLSGLIAASPVLPDQGQPATMSNLLFGLAILVAFLLAESYTKSRWLPARSSAGQRQEAPQPVAEKRQKKTQAPVDSESRRPKKPLSFSLKNTAELILADDVVDQREAELLLQMLDGEDISAFDPLTRELHQALIGSLDDGVLDKDEAFEIKVLLSEICDRPIAKPVKPDSPKKRPKKNKAKRVEAAASGSEIKRTASESRKPKPGDILVFSYIDSKGDVSDREVEFKALHRKNGVAYLKGICRERRAFRTFRTDRIEIPCFADTGEMIDGLR